MELHSLETLLQQNKPEQIILLEDLLSLFSQSPHLSHAYVRGSITRNALDRASDLDLVLAFEDSAFENVIENLQTLMSENFGVLLPGWLDTIVADFGGLGFVYVIERGGALMQLDLYLVPSSRAEALPSLAKSKLIYRKELKDSDVATESPYAVEKATRFIQDFRKKAPAPQDLLVGVVVISLLIRKRVKRNQIFLNYSETHLMTTMIRTFFRAVSDPSFVNYGWYHIEERLPVSEEGQRQLAFLEVLIKKAAFHTHSSLKSTLVQFLDLAAEAAPISYRDLETGISFITARCGYTSPSERALAWNRN